jgi:GTPase
MDLEKRAAQVAARKAQRHASRRPDADQAKQVIHHATDKRASPRMQRLMALRDRANRRVTYSEFERLSTKHVPNALRARKTGPTGNPKKRKHRSKNGDDEDDELLLGGQETESNPFVVPELPDLDDPDMYGEDILPEKPMAVQVALLGAPNAGKSVLVNRLVSSKISAVSHKRHTTRKQVLGVRTIGDTQLILFDTPGIVGEKDVKKFTRSLVTAAWEAYFDADVTLVVVDAVKKIGSSEKELIRRVGQLRDEKCPDMKLALVLNKVDLVKPKTKLLDAARLLLSMTSFDEVFYVSALKSEGLDDVRDFLVSNATPQPWMFADHEISDQTPTEYVSEIIREKLFRHLNHELPYNIRQKNSGWYELDDGSLFICQQLLVDRRSQMHIVIGKHGSVLKSITDQAQTELTQVMNRHVRLDLQVKLATGKEDELEDDDDDA